MKLVNAYHTVTIESGLTKSEFLRAQYYAPTACTLLDAEKQPVFGLDYSKHGTTSAYGIEFDNTTAEDKMFVTMHDAKIPADAAARATYLQENYGPILFKLQALENQIRTTLDTLAADIASVADSIEIR